MENMIYNALNNVKGNTILGITYFSKVKMNKGGRQQANSLYNENVVRVTTTELQFGNIYENSVNNRSEKESGIRVFQTEAPKGKKWVKFPYFLTNLDGSKTYVRFYKMKNVKGNSFVLVNGELINEEQKNVLKEYEIKHNSFSQKQAENGLTENQVEIRDICLDNIISIVVKGERVVNMNSEVKVGV